MNIIEILEDIALKGTVTVTEVYGPDNTLLTKTVKTDGSMRLKALTELQRIKEKDLATKNPEDAQLPLFSIVLNEQVSDTQLNSWIKKKEEGQS